MSITIQRATEVLGMAVTFNGCGRCTSDELKEAVNAAQDALREKAERENAPTHYTVKADITDEQMQELKNMLSGAGSIMVASDDPPSVEIIPRWIPVSEMLPEKDGRYLVYDGDTGNYYDSYFDETECEFGEWQMCFDPSTLGAIDSEWNSCPNVTHWMPLPEPPKEVE